MQGQFRIEQLWAFVVIDDDDTEGVIAFQSPGGSVPMVGADMTRVNWLKPMAQAIARELGKTVHLVKFTQREEIEEIR